MPTYNRNKDGYYKTSIVTGYTPDGKQKRVTVRSKNLSEFKEKLKSAQNLNDHGYDFDNKNITVAEWADKWYNTYKKHKVSHGTATSYEIDLRRHILPVIGGYKLTDVRPDMLQDLLNKFEGHSTSHADKIKLTLKQLFWQAYHDGLILRNVSDCLNLPDTVEGERRALTTAEENAVVKAVKTHRAGLWVMIMLRADLRPKETVPLMWSDIDFTPGNETITVRRAVEWQHNSPSLKKPKKKEKRKGKKPNARFPLLQIY